jgi:hypothetical protein
MDCHSDLDTVKIVYGARSEQCQDLPRSYHHGALRPGADPGRGGGARGARRRRFSLREAARRAGVSPRRRPIISATPRALLTALAAGAFREFGDALEGGRGGREPDRTNPRPRHRLCPLRARRAGQVRPDVALVDAKRDRLVIFASTLGTVFEWYDFFIYGTLAPLIGKFFPPPTTAVSFLLALASFGVGFGVRPLGAVLFGYLGDRLGRKYTFLVTITLMGIATAAVGLLPDLCGRSESPRRSCSSSCGAAGAGARRRIWRRGDLRRRACASQQARLLHQLHPGRA